MISLHAIKEEMGGQMDLGEDIGVLCKELVLFDLSSLIVV